MPNDYRYLLAGIFLFSLLFWVGASHKDFHIDEYFSWVFSERCSFEEIFDGKDTGIGHPALYHLIQKSSQTVLPDWGAAGVRAGNYLAGLLALFFLFQMFRVYRFNGWIFLAVCGSATILNAFTFSRMYGLVLMAAALAVWRGERYVCSGRRSDLLIFACVAVLGFLTDFNYFLLVPYIGYVLFSHTRLLRKMHYLFFAIWVPLWLLFSLSYGARTGRGDFFWSLYMTFKRVGEPIFVSILTQLNIWYYELLTVAVLAIAAAVFMDYREQRHQQNQSVFYALLAASLAVFLLQVLLNVDLIRVRVQAPLTLMALLMLGIYLFRRRSLNPALVNQRLLLSLLGAMVIVLTMTTIVWRPLLMVRFFWAVIPLLLLYLSLRLGRHGSRTFAAILVISGVIFSFSGVVGNAFPAPRLERSNPLVFQDLDAYATQYLRSDNRKREYPYFLEYFKFQKSCRVCAMGTNQLPSDSWSRITVVGWHKFDAAEYFADQFEVVSSQPAPLRSLDDYLNRIMTPVRAIQFRVFELQRK